MCCSIPKAISSSSTLALPSSYRLARLPPSAARRTICRPRLYALRCTGCPLTCGPSDAWHMRCSSAWCHSSVTPIMTRSMTSSVASSNTLKGTARSSAFPSSGTLATASIGPPQSSSAVSLRLCRVNARLPLLPRRTPSWRAIRCYASKAVSSARPLHPILTRKGMRPSSRKLRSASKRSRPSTPMTSRMAVSTKHCQQPRTSTALVASRRAPDGARASAACSPTSWMMYSTSQRSRRRQRSQHT
mmetsp:Transcript_26174/g.66484  ORF Transcript_26174/g.66484 Transcript_26174/m.66484 type:complete len:245 (-) Transcript_26174:251-985(-)